MLPCLPLDLWFSNHYRQIFAGILEQNKISTKVVNTYNKASDKEIIENSLESELLATVEEHNVMGGLGSAVSNFNYKTKKPVKFLLVLKILR